MLHDRSSGNVIHLIQLTGKETAMLPYSSGTTGNPKGVIVSHNSLSANMTIFRQLSSVEQTTGKNVND